MTQQLKIDDDVISRCDDVMEQVMTKHDDVRGEPARNPR